MSEKKKIKARWYEFSLERTIIWTVAIGWIPLVWLGYLLNWTGNRDSVIHARGIKAVFFINAEGNRPRAPSGLWLLGEKGVSKIYFGNASAEERDNARLWFPEAIVLDRDTQ